MCNMHFRHSFVSKNVFTSAVSGSDVKRVMSIIVFLVVLYGLQVHVILDHGRKDVIGHL